MLRTSMDWLFRSSDGPPIPTEALGTATEKGKRSCQQPSNATPVQANIGSSCSKLMSQSAAPPRSWPFLKVGQFWQTNLSGWRRSRKTKASKAASVGGLFRRSHVALQNSRLLDHAREVRDRLFIDGRGLWCSYAED